MSSLLALLAALGCVVVGARAQTVGGGNNARATAPRMSVLFTAMGRDKKFVTTLKPEDVRLTVDGAPREILEMKRQAELPLFIAIVIDTSASQERVLPRTKLAADVFVRGMLAEPDRAAVVTFSGETTLEQPMTGDVSKIREAIARLKFVPPPGYFSGILVGGSPGGAPRAGTTGIWDAVYLVSDEVLSRSLGTGRRVMMLITDGVDTSSRLKIDDAVASALQSEAVVYVVGVGDDKNFDGVEKGPVRKLAERTGGRAFFPKKVDEITDIFTQISEELVSQYVLTFADPSRARDGSFHKVKLEVTNRELHGQGVELAYPQGFYAGNAPTTVKK
jgi:Ca-activated chloride channel family protein